MAHRTETLNIGLDKGHFNAFVGLCSCGWVSETKPDFQSAKIEANRHRVEGVRKASSDPTQTELPVGKGNK